MLSTDPFAVGRNALLGSTFIKQVLTFNGTQLDGSVNYNGQNAPLPGGAQFDQSMNRASIVLMSNDAGVTVRRGDVITDNEGFKHIVKMVQPGPAMLTLTCEY